MEFADVNNFIIYKQTQTNVNVNNIQHWEQLIQQHATEQQALQSMITEDSHQFWI